MQITTLLQSCHVCYDIFICRNICNVELASLTKRLVDYSVFQLITCKGLFTVMYRLSNLNAFHEFS